MSMTLQELKGSEPANASRTPQQVLDWMREMVDVVGRVTGGTAWGWATAHDIVERCNSVIASADPDDVPNKRYAHGTLGMLERGEGIDMSDPESGALIAVNVAEGIFDQAAADDLFARATTQQERWQAEGAPRPKLGHVMELS